jgi:hypothetical protein
MMWIFNLKGALHMEDGTRSGTPLQATPRVDHLWIALRFFGLFCLFLAAQRLVSILGNLFSIGVAAVSLPTSSTVDFQVQLVISSAIRLALFAALGVYLLRDGKAVFRGLWALSSVSFRTEENPRT